MSAPDWPETNPDCVVRLRALAAALPHVYLGEHVFDVPVERLWGVVGDLEGGVPRFEGNVASVEILRREGDRLEVLSRSPGPRIPLRFDAVLRPGWCVMRSRFADIGMAAVPEGDGRSRFAHFEGARWLGRLGKPLFRRNVEGDFRRLDALLREEGEGSASPG